MWNTVPVLPLPYPGTGTRSRVHRSRDPRPSRQRDQARGVVIRTSKQQRGSDDLGRRPLSSVPHSDHAALDGAAARWQALSSSCECSGRANEQACH